MSARGGKAAWAVVGACCVGLAITGGLLALTSVATVAAAPATGEARGWAQAPESAALPEWDTNLELIEDLSAADTCLLRHGVFPPGGIGHPNSALPYDGFDQLTAAFLTVRAQVLRAHPDLVSDVVRSADEVRVILGAAADGGAFDLAHTASSDPDLQESLHVLDRAGTAIAVEQGAGVSILKGCEIGDAFRSLTDAQGKPVTVLLQTAGDGALEARAPDRVHGEAVRIAQRFGPAVRVVIDNTEVVDFNEVVLLYKR